MQDAYRDRLDRGEPVPRSLLGMIGDEYTVDFGARILAAGRLMAPAPQPREAMPLYFVYERDGLVTSFDFPGNLFFAALSLTTGTGPLAYALAAAVSSG